MKSLCTLLVTLVTITLLSSPVTSAKPPTSSYLKPKPWAHLVNPLLVPLHTHLPALKKAISNENWSEASQIANQILSINRTCTNTLKKAYDVTLDECRYQRRPSEIVQRALRQVQRLQELHPGITLTNPAETLTTTPRTTTPLTASSIPLTAFEAFNWGECREDSGVICCNSLGKYEQEVGSFHSSHLCSFESSIDRHKYICNRNIINSTQAKCQPFAPMTPKEIQNDLVKIDKSFTHPAGRRQLRDNLVTDGQRLNFYKQFMDIEKISASNHYNLPDSDSDYRRLNISADDHWRGDCNALSLHEVLFLLDVENMFSRTYDSDFLFSFFNALNETKDAAENQCTIDFQPIFDTMERLLYDPQPVKAFLNTFGIKSVHFAPSPPTIATHRDLVINPFDENSLKAFWEAIEKKDVNLLKK